MADLRSSGNKMISGIKFPVWKFIIGICFVVGIWSFAIPRQAEAVSVTVMMDGTNQIIYDHDGAKMPTGEVIQVIYASNEAIHAPGTTGEATGGDSLIWTGVVGQGELGDPPYIMGPGAFIKEFVGGQSLLDDSHIYIRAWNGPSIESSTYYGDSHLSASLDAGAPPMPQSWSVPTFFASSEFVTVSVPADPSDATLEALSDTSESFTWQVNSINEKGFSIEVSATDPWVTIFTGTAEAGDDLYTIYGLSTNEAYWVRVRAYNEAGYSGYATAEPKYTLANAPINPSVLGVNGAGYDCVISWESGGAQSGFEVYEGTPEALGGALIYTGTAATTVDANLVADQAHFYYIYAYNGDNILTTYVSSADSDALPGTPEGLVTTNITTDSAYGTWDTGSYTGYFVISYGTQDSAADTVATTDEAAWTFTSLSATTEYYWKVAAVNVNGTSEYSSVASFTTEAFGIVAPNLPAGLGQFRSDGITAIATGEWMTESTVEISMSMSSPLSGTTLYPEVEIEPVGTDFNGTVTATGEGVPYSGTPVTGLITLENMGEGAYHWQARVMDSADNTGDWVSFGDNDESAMDFGVDMTPPASVYLISPESGSWLSIQTPTFSWEASSDFGSGLAKYELWIDSVKNIDVSSLEYLGNTGNLLK